MLAGEVFLVSCKMVSATRLRTQRPIISKLGYRVAVVKEADYSVFTLRQS